MIFKEYCLSKKIDYVKFSQQDPLLVKEWTEYFEKVSPDSFTQQKKFLINPIRLKYAL
jgi:hypothetical protein